MTPEQTVSLADVIRDMKYLKPKVDRVSDRVTFDHAEFVKLMERVASLEKEIYLLRREGAVSYQ